MLARGRSVRHQREAPRHAQMHQQVARFEIEEKVFAAATDGEDLPVAKLALEAARHRPSQARVAHHDPVDVAPHDVGQKPAARRLDFGKLRHG